MRNDWRVNIENVLALKLPKILPANTVPLEKSNWRTRSTQYCTKEKRNFIEEDEILHQAKMNELDIRHRNTRMIIKVYRRLRCGIQARLTDTFQNKKPCKILSQKPATYCLKCKSTMIGREWRLCDSEAQADAVLSRQHPTNEEKEEEHCHLYHMPITCVQNWQTP